MTNNRWLVLDVSYLCWRVYHSALRKLSWREVSTGVLFGFVRDFVSFQDIHSTTNLAFCFDSQTSLRKDVLPGYKGTRERLREKESPDDQKSRAELYQQIITLRTTFLKDIGFKNVFHDEGYEADDLIASICHNAPNTAEIVIISSDKDLYQLLSPSVSIWTPGNQTFTTAESFECAWGIPPRLWPKVKAIAGCNTDDIPGIKGVGEKTAVKWLKGELKDSAKAYTNIEEGKDIIRRNLPLVKLPMKGTAILTLRFDSIDPKKWDAVLREYGMKSLRNSPPPELTYKRGFHGS